MAHALCPLLPNAFRPPPPRACRHAAYVSVGLYGLLPQQLEGMEGSLDAISLLGCLGMGASLTLIHIYVTPLKRALQVRNARCCTLHDWLPTVRACVRTVEPTSNEAVARCASPAGAHVRCGTCR